MKLIEKLFSVTNNDKHKIIVFMGIKFKIYSSKLANRILQEELQREKYTIQQLLNKCASLNNEIIYLKNENISSINELKNGIVKLQKAESRSEYIHNKRFEQWLSTYRWLEHHNKVLNKIIEDKQDEVLKRSQIKYLFKNIHKNFYQLNIEAPKSFNEKIQWLSLNYYANNSEIHRIVDKYEFKKYIKKKLGDKYIIPLIGKWDNPDEINWDNLPKSFVLKSNWGGDGKQVKIIKDKNSIDERNLDEELRNWLSFDGNMYYYAFNGPSKSLKPCIIAEEYVEGLGTEFYDYKIFCFNGKPKIVYVASNWTVEHKMSYYDINWNKLELTYSNYEPFDTPKPKNLNKMIEVATTLSKDFPFVRVDFFDLNYKIVLSEMTFTPGGGFGKYEPIEWEYKLGDMLDISDLMEGKNE